MSRENLFTEGVNGSTKNMTITKRQSGDYIMHHRRGPNTKGLSKKQEAVQERFKLATLYAKSIMNNPEKRALYDAAIRPDFSAYTLAVADALRVPKVHEINTDNYTGTAGQLINVVATDDFKVTNVKVSIYKSTGELLESGEAIVQETGKDWVYTTTIANDELAGSKVVAVALDLPRNQGSLELTIG